MLQIRNFALGEIIAPLLKNPIQKITLSCSVFAFSERAPHLCL
jgi:hypothetical protein